VNSSSSVQIRVSAPLPTRQIAQSSAPADVAYRWHMSDITGRRVEYTATTLDRADLDPDPIAQLQAWLADAAAAGTREPHAMTLATAGADGVPSARIVLLRGLDAQGFTWYTNRESLKGRDLAVNPRAALVWHWERLQRQVRVSGDVAVIPTNETAAYFATRPRQSRLSAWASPQGQVLADRATLEAATGAIDDRYPDEIPLPPFWGGYRLMPTSIEFWQGRRSRMHDRFCYLLEGGRWRIDRLAP
jgi:pyridoxamine 5'-phosphate oxidase